MHISPDVTEDFAIDSSNLLRTSSNTLELFLGPTISQSCFTINTINDAVPEVPIKTFQFLIPPFVDGPSTYQVSPAASSRIVTILDDDCKCVDQAYILPWNFPIFM